MVYNDDDDDTGRADRCPNNANAPSDTHQEAPTETETEENREQMGSYTDNDNSHNNSPPSGGILGQTHRELSLPPTLRMGTRADASADSRLLNYDNNN